MISLQTISRPAVRAEATRNGAGASEMGTGTGSGGRKWTRLSCPRIGPELLEVN